MHLFKENKFDNLDFPYKAIGCWSDTSSTRTMIPADKTCNLIGYNKGHHYRYPMEPIGRCERCAKLKGHKYFALQNGFECYTSAIQSYFSFPSSACLADGRGGLKANMVYERKCKYRFYTFGVCL